MEPKWNLRHAPIVVLASLLLSFLAPSSAVNGNDIQVSVFSYPGLTEGDLSCSDEVDNLEEIISAIPGYTVDRTITTLQDVDGEPTFLEKLNDSRFFFVPDMEKAFNVGSTADFPASAVSAFRTWLNAGGVLVMTGTSQTKDVQFLNKITDWGLASASGVSGAARNDANASGTPFGDAALNGITLGTPSATDSITAGTAPAEANFTIMFGNATQAAVATMNYGRGTIIYLGWDFFNSGLVGSSTTACPANSDNWVQLIVPAALEYAAQLSEAGLANTTSEGGDLNYTYENAGTTYVVVVDQDASAPTASQIKAGVDYGGDTVLLADSATTSAGVEYTFPITGLTPASDYSAYLVTEYGSPPAFSAVSTANFSTAPGVPTVASVTPGDGQVSVAISPFGTETNFQYSVDDGANWITRSPAAVSSPWVISSLTNGQALNLKFRSTYKNLTGAATAAFSATPVGVADAPTSVSGTANGAVVSLTWTAPASNGGSAVTGYKIEITDDNGVNWTVQVANTGTTSTSATISGLTPGDYKFRVYAINVAGTSTASTASSTVSVTATIPGAPTELKILHNGFGAATVSWSAPTSDGDSPITGYTVQYKVSDSWVDLQANEGLKATVNNVWVTQLWSFRVAATNAIGTGPFATLEHTPPDPYSGPIVTNLSLREIGQAAGTTIDLEGIRLDEVSSCMIDGKLVQIVSKSANSMQVVLPALTPGIKHLMLTWGSGVVKHQDAFLVAENTEPLELDTDQKVNAGSFKGYVALYAKGYQGSRLSAKIGNDWVIVDELASNFERIVEFTGSGYQINLRIFIDRELAMTKQFVTK